MNRFSERCLSKEILFLFGGKIRVVFVDDDILVRLKGFLRLGLIRRLISVLVGLVSMVRESDDLKENCLSIFKFLKGKVFLL